METIEITQDTSKKVLILTHVDSEGDPIKENYDQHNLSKVRIDCIDRQSNGKGCVLATSAQDHAPILLTHTFSNAGGSRHLVSKITIDGVETTTFATLADLITKIIEIWTDSL